MIGEFDALFDSGECRGEVTVREHCKRCTRPISVCLCAHIASPPIKTGARVLIVQHPNEIKRPLRTVPLLEAALDDCHVVRCRKVYNLDRKDIKPLIGNRPAYVLYPSDDAISCSQLPKNALIIAIDGTWRQARGMLLGSTAFKNLPKCKVKNIPKCSYVIRTQPEEGFVSTLEAIAAALAETEKRPELHQILTAPLQALCQIQLDHGAEEHQSKQRLLAIGKYTGDRPISNRNKLNRERILIEKFNELNLVQD